MFTRSLLIASLAAVGFVSAPMPGATLYTFNFCTDCSNATLYSFDSTGSSPFVLNPIGLMGTAADYGGLAYNTGNSTMYLVDGRQGGQTANSSLYTVNLLTGAATLVGSTGVQQMFGLAYDSANNTLYGGVFEGGGLYTINMSTGAATLLAGSIGTIGAVENLAYDTQNGVLYGWSDCLSCAALYSINPVTGAGTLLSNSGLNSNDSGFVYDPATNLLLNLDVNGNLTSINPTTFAQTLIGTENTEVSGLGLVPGGAASVPEPSTVVLLGSGLAGLMWVRNRRGKNADSAKL